MVPRYKNKGPGVSTLFNMWRGYGSAQLNPSGGRQHCFPWCCGKVVYGAGSSAMATSLVRSILALRHIPPQVDTMGITFHLFICSFHFILYLGCPACL